MNNWRSWAAIAVFAGTYTLIISEKIHRVAAALGGAGLMLAIGATDDASAFCSEHSGIDWNVILLLMGMMMIVGVLKRTGLFEYLAIWAVKRARGRPFRVMVMLIVITASASALLDNVTTVLLVAPVTLLVCERLALPTAPFLIAEVFASNIGGTATLVGDPPNIIIGSRAGLTFNDFLVHLAPLAAVLVLVLIALARIMFRAAFTSDPARVAGFVNPGSEIAVFMSGTAGGQPFTRLLLPQVTVIGVGATAETAGGTSADGAPANTEQLPATLITLAVTQQEAQKILFAQGNGQLAVSLTTGTSKVAPGPATTLANLFE